MNETAIGKLVLVERGVAALDGETKPAVLVFGVLLGLRLHPDTLAQATNELWEIEADIRPIRKFQQSRVSPQAGAIITSAFTGDGHLPENWERQIYPAQVDSGAPSPLPGPPTRSERDKTQPALLTAKDIRRRLLVAIREAGSKKAWCQAHSVSEPYTGDVLRGDREPGKKICDALNIERVILYREKGQP